MKNHELITSDEDMMKAASDEFFRQFIKWANSSDVTGEGWIPVEDRLPDGGVNPITGDAYVYPVTVKLGEGTDIRYYSFCFSHWYNQGPGEMDDLVIAWKPVPEPYRPD